MLSGEEEEEEGGGGGRFVGGGIGWLGFTEHEWAMGSALRLGGQMIGIMFDDLSCIYYIALWTEYLGLPVWF